MNGLSLVPIFMIGLLGSVHCVGMCGGIVSAFSVTGAGRRFFPVAVVADTGAQVAALDGALRVVAYNTGRIGSYMVAGAIAGGIASGARALASVSSFQVGGYWLANGMLIVLGLYLTGAWSGLTKLESLGQLAWRRVLPVMRYVLPIDSPAKALALGGLWGWVPCGMVYSVLLTAMLTGSAASGARVMLAFGLGTLPTLMTLGLMGNCLNTWMRHRGVRIAAGVIVLLFGALGLVRAANGLSLGWLDSFCLSPPVAESHP